MTHGGPDVMRTAKSSCLECGAELDAIGTADRNKPAKIEPGDFPIVVCIHCGAVMTLDEQLRLRGFTNQEMDDLVADRETMGQLARLVRGVHMVKGQLN